MMSVRSNFGEVASLYARVRPGYPPAVFDDVVSLAGLEDGARILEIGPASGQATRPLAMRGLRITAVEPEASLVAEARRALPPDVQVEFHVARFEDWPLPEERFDAVLAATAFHWIEPAVRYVKTATALKPDGALVVINTHHVAGGTQAFFDDVQPCYATHISGARGDLRLPAAETVPPDTAGVVASGLFLEPERRTYVWQASYTATEYHDLLRTYSNHIAMARSERDRLFDCMRELIDRRFGGSIWKQYMTELVVARKR
jgi:ubiquinone/menaquinone biosynthesis C-methylase UbiE